MKTTVEGTPEREVPRSRKMKEMENTLLVKAFGNDLRCAGYRTIVDTLVFYGQMVSTDLAPKMDFGPMARFLRFEQPEGTGIVRIFFDHDAAMTSLEIGRASCRERV